MLSKFFVGHERVGGGEGIQDDYVAWGHVENFLLEAEPIDYDTGTESVVVAAQLVFKVLGMRLAVAERRLGLDPFDDCVSVQAWDGEQKIRCFVEAVPPKVAFVVECQSGFASHFLQLHLVLFPHCIPSHVDANSVHNVVEDAGAKNDSCVSKLEL